MTSLVNIIGAGHLGKTIGHLLVKNKLITMGAICNRSPASTIAAIEFIGEGQVCPSIDELPPADIYFITTPDDFIPIACETLSENKHLKEGSIVLHCSGSLTSDALIAVKKTGCYVASIHPMRSFAKPELSIEHYEGAYCAMEGDKEALTIIHFLFSKIGSITYEIEKEKKSLYHSAGVFASNYLITLSQQALNCLTEAGVKRELALQIVTNIMHESVSNLEKTQSPEQALTGPLQRGDTGTIVKHMDAFSDNSQKQLYAELGKLTLLLTSHEKSKKEALESALNATSYS